MRAIGEVGVIAAICFAFILGALTLLAYTLAYRGDSGGFVEVPKWDTAAELSGDVRIQKTEYLVRPEAPSIGVNIVKSVHQRAPMTDTEAAQWLNAEEMVAVEPGTAVRRIDGEAPGYAVTVEVVNGPHEGLRGWVWEDTLREQWP